MESPGKSLKNERMMRNISLEDISKFTKIKEHHLKAIEEERYELLPPAIYVKGFLKIYAKYLALDSKEILLQYQKYLESLTPPPEPTESKKQALPQKKGSKSWLFFSLVIAIFFSTVITISIPRRYSIEIEEKPNPISLPLSSSPSVIQHEVEVQRINLVQQKEFSEPFKLETYSPIPRLEGQGSPPPQDPSESLRHQPSRVAQPRSSDSLPQVGIDPDQRLMVTSSKEGLNAIVQVKDIPTQQPPSFEVTEAGIGTGIERDGLQQFLIGRCSDFTSNGQRGYFFTRIKGPRAGKITHIWLWEGKEYYRMEIDVKPPSWSVYSYLTFRPRHAGNWRAEVRDGDHVLTCLNFKVLQSSGVQSL
jgi:cytoskeletal protein RodZ